MVFEIEREEKYDSTQWGSISISNRYCRSKNCIHTKALIQQRHCCVYVCICQIECVSLTLKLQSMVYFITRITDNFQKLFFAGSVMCGAPGGQSAEVPVGLRLKPQSICYPQLWEPLLRGGDTGTLCPPQMCHIYPWAMDKTSRKQDGFGVPAHVILPRHTCEENCGPGAKCHGFSIWDRWTWVLWWPVSLKSVHMAGPGALLGSDEDHGASWKAPASDNKSFFSLH